MSGNPQLLTARISLWLGIASAGGQREVWYSLLTSGFLLNLMVVQVSELQVVSDEEPVLFLPLLGVLGAAPSCLHHEGQGNTSLSGVRARNREHDLQDSQ